MSNKSWTVEVEQAPDGEYFMSRPDSVNLKTIKNDARTHMGMDFQQETT